MLKTTGSTVVFWLVVISILILSVAGLYIYSRDSIGTLLQVIAAIAVVIILFVIAFSVYNMELVNAVRNSNKTRKAIPIFRGMKDLNSVKDETYNTLDPNASTYIDLGPSVGQEGGGEYAYNFWLYVDATKSGVGKPAATADKQFFTDGGYENVATKLSSGATAGVYDNNDHIILFLRGSKKPYKYKGQCFDANATLSDMDGKKYKTDIMIKSPLVKLERGLDVLTIEFNTMETPDAVKEKSNNSCDDASTDWEAMNAYKVSLKNFNTKYDKQWVMVTVTLQDTYPSDPLPIRNKIRCTIYVNSVVELDKYIDGQLDANRMIGSTLKQNSGNLYINPQISASNIFVKGDTTNTALTLAPTKLPPNPLGVIISDLTYFNYTPDEVEVKNLFGSGVTKKWAPSISAQSNNADTAFMDQQPSMPDKAQLRTLTGRG